MFKHLRMTLLVSAFAMITANAAVAQYVIHVPLKDTVPPKEAPPESAPAIEATPRKSAPVQFTLREVHDVSPAPSGPPALVASTAIDDTFGWPDSFGDKGCSDLTKAERLPDGTIRATCRVKRPWPSTSVVDETYRIFRVGRKIVAIQCSVAVRISDC